VRDIGCVAEPRSRTTDGEEEPHFGQVTKSSDLAHHTIHLLGPPLACACTFQASRSWIRINETTERLEVS
jgi:hypothetical protein